MINHDEIADAIADGLEAISRNIEFWRQQADIHKDNPRMGPIMVRLYVVIFKCFAGIFQNWSGSSVKRFLHSFDAGFLNTIIKDHLDKMNELSQELSREAELKAQDIIINKVAKKEDFSHIAKTEELERIASRLSQEYRDQLAQMHDNMKQAFQVLGKDVRIMLLDQAQQLLQSPSGAQRTLQPTGNWSSSQPISARSLGPTGGETVFSQKDLQDDARCLGIFVQRDILQTLRENLFGLEISMEVYRKLQEWNSKPSRAALWIEGPSEAETPSQNTLTSASLVSVTQRTSVNSIFYFCQLPTSPGALVGNSTQAFLHAISSLISQLVQYVPAEFNSDVDFSTTRFAGLDGSDRSLPKALSLLRDVLCVSTGLVYCVIDGIQFLENLDDSPYTALMEQFIGLLCGADLPSDLILKSCFTTDGYSSVLGDLSRADRVEQITYDLDAVCDRHGESTEMNEFIDEYD